MREMGKRYIVLKIPPRQFKRRTVRKIKTSGDTVPTEHEEQRDFVMWFRQTYPGVLIFAIPNGGPRSKIAGGKLKAEGVVAGVPDLFIPEWRLFIEMKRAKGGVVSEAQSIQMAELKRIGYNCRICRGAAEAKLAVLNSGYI